MAALKKRPDGRYRVRYKGKEFYGQTQREARQKMEEYKAAEAAGLALAERMPFRIYCARWLPVYKAKVKNKQYDQYAAILDDAADRMGDPIVDSITPTMVQALFNEIAGMSDSYIAKYTSTVKSVLQAAYRDGVAHRDPSVGLHRPEGTSGTHRALEQWEDDVLFRLQDHRMGAAVMVMRYAGLRRGEACYLDVDRDVDFKRHLIHVRGAVAWDSCNQPSETKGKTESAIRTVPLLEPVERCLQGRHGLLVARENGKLLSQSAFKRAWESWQATFEEEVNGYKRGWWERRRLKALEEGTADLIPEWIPCTIRTHDFRHSYCSDLYAAGVDIKTAMTWMGHSDMSMIMEIYTHLRKETEAAAEENMRKLLEEKMRLKMVKMA